MDLLIDGGAIFDADKKKRNRLWRIWDAAKPMLNKVLTNPSIENEDENDPTVERGCRRARLLNYGGVPVCPICMATIGTAFLM
jgi:hypothetical protein